MVSGGNHDISGLTLNTTNMTTDYNGAGNSRMYGN